MEPTAKEDSRLLTFMAPIELADALRERAKSEDRPVASFIRVTLGRELGLTESRESVA